MILENVFVRSVVIPIIFSIASAFLNWGTELVKGKAEGAKKYRIWEWEDQADGTKLLIPIGKQSIDSIRKRHKKLEHIDLMADVGVENFVSLSIELTMAAILIDITSLIILQNQQPSNDKLAILVIHLIILFCVILLVALCRSCSPEETDTQKNYAKIGIGLGLLAMIGSFLVL